MEVWGLPGGKGLARWVSGIRLQHDLDSARTGWARQAHLDAQVRLSTKADGQPPREVSVDTGRYPLGEGRVHQGVSHQRKESKPEGCRAPGLGLEEGDIRTSVYTFIKSCLILYGFTRYMMLPQ